jgi:hypothetical protein
VNKHIFQIYYDDQSRRALDPGFIPLDNTANLRPDWFEFWVIRNFLKSNRLEEDGWYGFLSPKFADRTGASARQVHAAIDYYGPDSDILLYSAGWDQIAYFLNPFEQGEFWHPGLRALSQSFFDRVGLEIDLETMVSHSANAAFSNYVVARPAYWRKWLALADPFFDIVEAEAEGTGLAGQTSYGKPDALCPMKTFIQERFPAVILSDGALRGVCPDQLQHQFIYDRLFGVSLRVRRMLQACDVLKAEYCRTGDEDYLRMYRKIREEVGIRMAPAGG